MSDQLLKITDSNLGSIAAAIRSKAGLSNNQELVFPDTNEQGKLGMITALQSITTEVTVTPKIAAQQVTLDKDTTSFAITPGFHNGNGTVHLNLQSKTVTPGASQQDVTPDSGYLLSQVLVNAVSGGYKIAQGTATYSNQESITLSGFQFTPAGFVVLHTNIPELPSSGAGSSIMVLFTYNDPDTSYQFESWHPSYIETSSISGAAGTIMYGTAGYNMVSSQYNSLWLAKNSSNGRFNGTYFYFIWGN